MLKVIVRINFFRLLARIRQDIFARVTAESSLRKNSDMLKIYRPYIP